MTAWGPETTVRVPPSVYARAFGEEIVLLHFARGEYYGLDPIGARVWELFAAGKSLRDAAEFVSSNYEVSFEQALVDVEALASELEAQSLIDVASAAATDPAGSRR